MSFIFKVYTYVLGWIIKGNKTIVSKEIILVDQSDTIMSKLKPTETVNKMLISTTSRLVGEYEHKDFLITHAWPSSHSKPYVNLGLTENPLCRNYYVIVFTSPKIDSESIVIPDYSPTGDVICTYLSILFGKRFDNHGLLESHGSFRLPSLETSLSISGSKSVLNSHSARIDLGIYLSLDLIDLISDLLLDYEKFDQHFLHILQSAGKFYAQALRVCETHPEIAFLNLITCGEILSNFPDYDDNEPLDDQMKDILKSITAELKDGLKTASIIRSKLFLIRAKYTRTICSLLNDYFFTNTESKHNTGRLENENIEMRIKASYDLRSRYVHTGLEFGNWILKSSPYYEEIQLGIPVVDDREYQKLLHKSPTFYGMERIMRFCLLRFMQKNGIKIDRRLED